MTKQDEIREGVARIGLGGIDPIKNAKPNEYGYKIADNILEYLHSKGVAIVTHPYRGTDLTGYSITKVEPLVEEE